MQCNCICLAFEGGVLRVLLSSLYCSLGFGLSCTVYIYIPFGDVQYTFVQQSSSTPLILTNSTPPSIILKHHHAMICPIFLTLVIERMVFLAVVKFFDLSTTVVGGHGDIIALENSQDNNLLPLELFYRLVSFPILQYLSSLLNYYLLS